MHLQPEPLFHVPSDNVSMVCVEGTPDGRLFLAGKDGCLYEITYQAEDGWFSKKCRKINHSVSMVSYLVPSFLSFSEEGIFVVNAEPQNYSLCSFLALSLSSKWVTL